jgi:hypothetical protein
VEWKIKAYDLENNMERRRAKAKIESIEQMWNRETPGINKTTETGQIKSSHGHYLFNIQIYEESNILVVKEKSVFKK